MLFISRFFEANNFTLRSHAWYSGKLRLGASPRLRSDRRAWITVRATLVRRKSDNRVTGRAEWRRVPYSARAAGSNHQYTAGPSMFTADPSMFTADPSMFTAGTSILPPLIHRFLPSIHRCLPLIHRFLPPPQASKELVKVKPRTLTY